MTERSKELNGDLDYNNDVIFKQIVVTSDGIEFVISTNDVEIQKIL